MSPLFPQFDKPGKAGSRRSTGEPGRPTARPLIFRRSLYRELATTSLALFIVLLGILFSNLVLRILRQAAGGSLAGEGVGTLIGFYAIYYLPILLSLTVFLAVLLTLTRNFRDSEMIVWFTSGMSLTAWLRPILVFAAPFLALVAVSSLWLSPWAEQRKQQFQQQLDARDEFSLISPGLFKEFRRADLVVFVESLNTFDGTINSVFAHSNEKGKEVTLVASKASIEDMPNGDRFVVLKDGRRYEGTPGAADFRVVEFESLGRRIEPNEVRAVPVSVKAQPTDRLVMEGAPSQLGEFFWRLSVPTSALLLVLLAIPLSYINPRMGRSFNLVAAVLVYMVYNNLLSILQSWISIEKIGTVVSFLVLHGAAALLVLAMFRSRMRVGRGRG